MFTTTSRRTIAAFRAGLLLTALVAVGGVAATPAHAQKKLDRKYTGSISATLLSEPNVVPDIYSFDAEAGEIIVFNTSLTDMDTTIGERCDRHLQ